EQTTATELAQQTAQAVETGGLGLRLLLEAAKDRGQQRIGTGGRLRLAHSQFARDGLQPAHLSQDIGDLHASLLGSGHPPPPAHARPPSATLPTARWLPSCPSGAARRSRACAWRVGAPRPLPTCRSIGPTRRAAAHSRAPTGPGACGATQGPWR